ncbi:MAG: uroporphyrinogen-III synthase [Rhodospirillales bacterium]|nr:uroporphyrinogen-III synthase [Rhodospirillales bacterium]
MRSFVVLTRSLESCGDLDFDLNTMGFTPVLAPMTRIVPGQIPENRALSGRTLIFTSANAVRVFSSLCALRGNPVLTVGDQTAHVARARGFTDVWSAQGTGADIVAHIVARYDPVHGPPMTHLCGAHLATSIEAILEKNGFDIKKIEIYSAEKTKEILPEARAVLHQDDPVYVLFFSSRAAQNFQTLAVHGELVAARALCLSARVAAALDPDIWKDILVADRPDRAGMLDLVRFSCARGRASA